MVAVLAKEYALADLYVTHRLDRLTSGVVIFAKNKSKADDIRRAIEQHAPLKIYLGDAARASRRAIRLTALAALVRGCPSWDVTTIDVDLACDDKRMVQYRCVWMCGMVVAVIWWL